MTSKIVVIGDVNGQFPTVFKKVAALHAKNNFAFAIIAGNLFTDPAIATEEDESNIQFLISGRIDLPLTTYFALGTHPFPPSVVQKLESSEDDSLCQHLFFLGKRTSMKTSEGIHIVALGGHLDSNIISGPSKDKYPPFYGEADAKELQNAGTADILITSQWPTGIRKRSNVDFQLPEPASHSCVADLDYVLKPRYHFSTSGDRFWEREPFFHPSGKEENDGLFPITRFISLASYGNLGKQKWIYAFSLDPTASHPISIPSGSTICPFALSTKKRAPPTSIGLVYEDSHRGGRFSKKRRTARGPLDASQCFFCLANEDIATHLIASISDNVYLTTAKGPLPTNDTFPKLGFPGHMLIIPINHQSTLAAIEEEDRNATYTEMQKYQSAINSTVKSLAGEDFGSVTWEVSKSSLPHTHWQYLPVPADLIQKRLVEAAFKALAENAHWPEFEKEDVGDGFGETSDFFRFMVWDPKKPEDESTSFIMRFDEKIKFRSQFGREVLAKLLRLDDRLDWHNCGQTHEEEEENVVAFKEAFKPFKFSEV
ncbi:CwfJ domain-containing protein [Amniculicola lignicola CBS 123094]|uniref:CwfJ domain-containing protein n=1 Tax=Amniculicola lignicola CBS 123094 TaxID=1392246 RepID=A0A6A5WHV6_9PLEO|nr:CwfJ domain-containing protein [Amniculicola lignicola CBS 123094]